MAPPRAAPRASLRIFAVTPPHRGIAALSRKKKKYNHAPRRGRLFEFRTRSHLGLFQVRERALELACPRR